MVALWDKVGIRHKWPFGDCFTLGSQVTGEEAHRRGADIQRQEQRPGLEGTEAPR